jgi:hypothetical protein
MSRLCTKVVAGLLVAVASLGPAVPARAQVAVISGKSPEAVLSDFKYLAALAGQKDLVKEVDDFLKKKGGDDLWKGVDAKRPLGAYVLWPDKIRDLDSLSFPVVYFVPVADEARFLNLLKEDKPTKRDGGLYQLSIPEVPELYLRFANRYAYFSTQPAMLRAKLPDPVTLLPPGAHKSTIAANIRFDQLPPDYKQLIDLVIEPVSKAIAEQIGDTEKKPGETEAQYKQRQLYSKQMKDGPAAFRMALVALVAQSRELALNLDVDQSRHQLSLDLTLTPRADTPLAAFSQYAGTSQSRFGYFARDASLSAIVHFPAPPSPPKPAALPDDFPEALRDFVEPKYREPILKAAQVLVPTLLKDGLNLGVTMRPSGAGPDTVTLIGLKVQNGDKLDRLIRDTVKNLSTTARSDFVIDWNRERYANARIHELKKFAGAEQPGFLAMREDVVFLALGKESLQTVKDALDEYGRAVPMASPLFQFDAASALFLEHKEFAAAVEKMSLADRDKVRVRVSIQGGKALRLRVEAHSYFLKLAASDTDQ